VGLVFIGCLVRGKVVVRECHFRGDRDLIRKKAVAMALLLLEEVLEAEA
jgi:nicotinamide-nucleotide amidase